MNAGKAAGVDRSRPPGPARAPELRLPECERFRLSNGLKVWVLETHRLPEVSIRMLLDAGAVLEEPRRSGVAELTGELLTEGAGGRSALEVAEWLDRLGAGFGVSVGYDAALVSMHLLAETVEEGLDFLRTVVRAPEFSDEEVARVRKERVDEIERDRDEPSTVADEALIAAVYGEHAYGRPSGGLHPTVASLDRDAVREFHAERYVASGSAVVVCGDVDAGEVRRGLEARFGDLESGEAAPLPEPPDPRPAAEADTVLVHRPRSAQSELRVGAVGLTRDHGDYYRAKILEGVLGGLFNSRLNMNLREEKGWTYGVRTSFDFRRLPGPFVGSVAVETGATAAAFREFDREIRGIVEEPPTEDEMRLAKNALTLSLPRQFETAGQISRKAATQALYGLEPDYWERYTARVEAVDRDEVVEAAREYLEADRLVRVAVGDADEVAAGLEELGSLEVREPEALTSGPSSAG